MKAEELRSIADEKNQNDLARMFEDFQKLAAEGKYTDFNLVLSEGQRAWLRSLGYKVESSFGMTTVSWEHL